MLKRYRWFRLGIPGRVRLVDLLRRKSVTPERGRFAEAELPDGEMGFRFLWNSQVVVTRVDERGVPHREAVSSINYVEFSLAEVGKATLMRVVDPGRNLSELIGALESIVGYGFTCASVSFERRAPLSILDRVDEARLVSLKIRNVVVRDGIIGRMEFASKAGIAGDDLKKITVLPHSRDQATYELVYRGVRGQFSYSSNGSIRIGGVLSPRILSYVERDLSKDL